MCRTARYVYDRRRGCHLHAESPSRRSVFACFPHRMPPKAFAAQDIEDVIPSHLRRGVHASVLSWYDRHRRALPWRKPVVPDTDAAAVAELQRDPVNSAAVTPYAVWVSEVMSQQTQISTLIPFWCRWLQRFPSAASLASASVDDALALWSGLGYYRRARMLHAGAVYLVRKFPPHGALPNSVAALEEIPGIGPYTAGMIASVCFGAATPVVDGNVLRVLSRMRGASVDVKSTAVVKSSWSDAAYLLGGASANGRKRQATVRRPGDWNQALMEIGATVCAKVGSPRCADCPLRVSGCRAAALLSSGAIESIEGVIPLVSRRVQRATAPSAGDVEPAVDDNGKRRLRCTALVITWSPDGAVWLRRSPSSGLLARLWGPPQLSVPATTGTQWPQDVEAALQRESEPPKKAARSEVRHRQTRPTFVALGPARLAKVVRHEFSHVRYSADVWWLLLGPAPSCGDVRVAREAASQALHDATVVGTNWGCTEADTGAMVETEVRWFTADDLANAGVSTLARKLLHGADSLRVDAAATS